jgi:hypothetical protein
MQKGRAAQTARPGCTEDRRSSVRKEDIAWAAGLFEGEGCWNAWSPPSRRANGRRRPMPQMKLGMTDADVVGRFAEIVDCGNLRRPRSCGPAHWKPIIEWSLYRRADIFRLIGLFWPYLGERRKAKAQEILDLGEAVPYGKRTHCPQGHLYEGDNLETEQIKRHLATGEVKTYTARRCRTCRRKQARERKRREKGDAWASNR